jgi:hypothetical protein
MGSLLRHDEIYTIKKKIMRMPPLSVHNLEMWSMTSWGYGYNQDNLLRIRNRDAVHGLLLEEIVPVGISLYHFAR